MSRIRGWPHRDLAMPIKSTSPVREIGVGGVSGRAGAKAGRRQSFRKTPVPSRSMRWKASRSSGRRDPSRGHVRTRISVGPLPRDGSSVTKGAPMTADVLRAPRRGTPSSTRNQRTCTRRRHEKSSQALRRRVLHSVRRPVHVNPHYTSGASSMVRRWWWHRGWANLRKQEEPAPGSSWADGARLAACHRSRKGGSMARQKRKEVEASVPARIKSSGLVARTSLYVAEVGRRRLVSNKLGKRAPKRAAGSSEQGPSFSRPSAGETAGGSRRAKRRIA